jgi:hypothetical protein
MKWPDWWSWDLELSPHLLKRMIDRDFNEADLRLMLEEASGYYENHEPNRYVAVTLLGGSPWEVVVEPDPTEHVLVVVTAYPTGEA